MKIAIIAHNKFPIAEPYAGGLEMITDLLVRGLKERGHEVHLYAIKGSNQIYRSLEPYAIVDKELLDDVTANIGCDDIFIEEHLIYANLLNHLKREEYDVIHNHSLHYQALIQGNLLAVPFITTFHTPAFPLIKLGLQSIRHNIYQQFTLVSNNLHQEYVDLIDNYEVVHNGIDLNFWNFNTNPSGDYLIFVGRICVEKGVHKAIEIAFKTKIQLKICGPKSNEDYFEEHIAAHLDHELIEYCGHKTQEELNQLIGNARATLFTSLWHEPFGLVITESLACGTPVIAFNRGAAAEILTAACGLIIEDEGQIDYNAILSFINNVNRKDCRALAERHFCYHSMVGKYEELYKSVLV